MHQQNQIKRTLREEVEVVRAFLAERPEHSRNALAVELCRRFDFHDSRGKPQQTTCLNALRTLAGEGLLVLPSPRITRHGAPSPRRLSEPVPPPEDVPERVDLIQHLVLREVESEEDFRRWNEVILREHPFGNRRLVGRQLRYLIESEHGCLGAVGFSSAALRLRDRDAWIGWDSTQKAHYLDRVVCLSRLLIRPETRCANLASHVLGLLATRVGNDFEQRYHYRPWMLETFVEKDHHDGASLRAANWTPVGRSRGRGRQDRTHEQNETIKDIYVYVLDDTFRQTLGVPAYQRYRPQGVEEGLGEKEWARQEFGEAKMGDQRLSRRLVSIAEAKGASPGLRFSEAVRGGAAALAGYYRFMDQPDESRVKMDEILAPHRHRTLCRMQAREEVLCIHDTTDLNYATLLACEGLGVIGKNQTGTESGGLRLHSSYVVSAEEGLPLGLLDWQCGAPKIKEPGQRARDGRWVAMEEKSSYRWIENLKGCAERAGELENTHIIHVMDREGDFFDLFDQWRETHQDDLIVRAKHNRPLSEKGSSAGMFETVSGLGVMGEVEVTVPRKSARGKKGNQAPREAQPKRNTRLELRWMPTRIRPPRKALSSKKEPVPVWILHAREAGRGPSAGKRVEWYLFSSMAIEKQEDAVRLLEYYAKRWRIEDWHRILKTCCRVEEPAHQDAECLKRLIAINMVIAWRIHLMTLLGREMPDLPMELLFADMEIRVLGILSKQRGWAPPENLGEAVITMARMGGYMNRKHDPPPGAELLWRGHRQLTLLSQGLGLAQLE